MTIIASLGTIFIIALMAYDGARNGLFASCYALVRNVLGFLFAFTLFEPLGGLLSRLFAEEHPGPLYLRAVAFVALFGAVFTLGRWLKISYTEPRVPSYRHADRVGGGALGLLNGFVLAGVVLIFWSLMPFAKFLPRDFGRVRTDKLPVDAGSQLLRFYNHCTHTMGGGKRFLLNDEPILADKEEPFGVPDALRDIDGDGEPDMVPGESFQDENGNGRWDRGWLWRYRAHADFHMEDFRRAVGAAPRPAASPAGGQ